jgi:signal transduction histidine kinase
VTIEVHDNGPGIPAESVARLFKRDRLNVLGSGLSLLMISDVCVAHGGRLDVTSSTQPADHGTTGRMTLSAA